jgi:hypothetical protein
MKTLEYRLTQPIEYSDQGEMVPGEVLVLTAPKGNQRKEITKLKQTFFRAISSGNESLSEEQIEVAKDKRSESESEEIEINSDEVLFIVMQSSSVDYADFIEIGRKVILGGICKIDGVKTVNAVIVDRLSVEDLENLIGSYVAFFIVSSAMKSMQSSI